MKPNTILLFETSDKKINVDVIFEDETVWLSLEQMARLFDRDKSTISRHIKNIFEEGELDEKATVANFATVQTEGARAVERTIEYYNLDVIISVGYRVKSLRGTQFRQWATKHLNEFIRKGFTLDDERLKNGSSRYFKELLQRIRDIRSSERNFYQQVTDIYATAIDYNPKSEITKEFFATVQNKMHFAIHGKTSAEIIYERADKDKVLMGMTNFKGNYITKSDVSIAKNYLSEGELQKLNLLVSGFLEYAELQALNQNPMSMQDWIAFLDRQLQSANMQILMDKGKISHKAAVEKAEKEFEEYRKSEMKNLISDFDKATRALKSK